MKYLLILSLFIMSIWEKLGGIGAFIGGLAALGALIFAIKGFHNLKGQLRELRKQNELTKETMSRVYRPR